MVKIILRRDPVLRGLRRYALQSTEQAAGCQAALANYHVFSRLATAQKCDAKLYQGSQRLAVTQFDCKLMLDSTPEMRASSCAVD